MTAAEPSAGKSASERNQAFERLAEPLRREIKVHCYRMLGSVHEAEDLVQETFLRAWRSFESFEGGSFRAWLYRVATNACLNALESRKSVHRRLPDQLGPAVAAMTATAPATDVAWLEPFPDSDLASIVDEASDPEARYSSRESVRLAFVAAIQELPPRQRATLLLCDVLGWAAAEVATLLGGSTASINSALQRARETLGNRYRQGQRPAALPRPDGTQQDLLGRYLKAWEGHDLDAFVALLKEDAAVTMPPWLQWFIGREAVRSFFAVAWTTCGGLRLKPTAANGQPAFAIYEYSATEARWCAHSIHVLTFESGEISAVTLFLEPRLFEAFGLAPALDEPPPAAHHS
jgi:RNA polymerase sigma-70 factor (ECF subfamily)